MGNKRRVATLSDKLTAPDVQPKVVRACEDLIAAEVESKRGLAGMAVKAAYKVVKAIKPGVMGELVTNLLPDFAAALDPMHEESVEVAERGGRPLSEVFPTHLESSRPRTAEALLSVTDKRAAVAKNRTLKKAYDKLRGVAQQHVEAAVPGLARTIAPFV